MLLRGTVSPVHTASLLTALKMKSESLDEIVGFIQTIRKHMVDVPLDGMIIDTCGTGGDGKGTFNISTATALVVAGCGVKVAKHGNRAASSTCGSADVLEALGVNINLNVEQAKTVFQKTGMVFLFAPLFHPAFKYVVPIRKELKIPTVFNFLGPFVNPTRVKRQVIGVPNISIAEKLASVARQLDYEYVAILSSRDGLDEISGAAPTDVFEVIGKRIRKKTIKPKDFDLENFSISSIQGGNTTVNAEIIYSLLDGKKGPHRNIVVMNAAYTLTISGKANSLLEGKQYAIESIDSHRAKQVLETLISSTKTSI
jgi:anthranilate phosphoribosyltransferase